MVESDKVAFESIMQALAENFNATLSKNGIALRYEALKTFDIQTLKQAALALVATRKFSTMPTIGDFVEHLSGGPAEDIGMIEANKVWQAVRKHGGSRTVCFDDPVTQAVIVQAFGGWQTLCEEQMEKNHQWFIKDFVKAYGAFSRRGVKEFGALPGRSDPFDAKGEPAFIGNVEKAQLIYKQAEPQKQITQ